jgi:SAM-dependent methyltransferase
MQDKRPSLEGLEQVLNLIASDPRLPQNLPDWIRASLRTSGLKLQILQRVFSQSSKGAPDPSLLDVGAQFASLAIYASELGCRAAAVDYGPLAKVYREIAVEHSVDYRECDLGSERLPFPDGAVDFVSYTDVIEHHSFSPKRVLREIHRVLVPGGQVILVTPNHASIYNRLKLLSGCSVHDDLNYFFDSSSGDAVYDGHHREYTRADVKTILQRTGFRVKECRVIEQELGPLLHFIRGNPSKANGLPNARDVVLCVLGEVWRVLHLPFGRWIWAVGEKQTG